MSPGAYFKAPILILAFLSGVALRSFFNVPQNWAFVGLGLTIGFLAVAFFIGSSPQEVQSGGPGFFSAEKTLKTRAGRAPYVLLIILLGGFFLGIIRFSFFENNIKDDLLHEHYGETMTLSGTVISYERKENSASIVLDTDMGRLMVVNRIYPEYKYGDLLEVTGKIIEPANYGDFDKKKFLAKDRIYSEMVFPEISETKAQFLQDLAQRDGASRAIPQQRDMRVLVKIAAESKRVLFSLKEKFQNNIRSILPEPHASLADGMLLGGHGLLDSDLLDDFRRSGTIHILVLSGYNITIVGAFVLGLASFFLPELFGWLFAVFAILLFTVISGAEAAAVRSSIMAIIGLVALRSGRKNAAINALVLAAFIMVFWNPMLMAFDRGFQLSFLATLGLISASPFFKKIFSFLPEFSGLRENAASAFSAQLFVLPLLFSWGGEISWFSPLSNILVVGAVPFIMLFSFLGGAVAFISIPFGKVVAGAAYLLISYQIYFVRFFGSLEFSIIQFNFIPVMLLGLLYLLLFYWSFKEYAKNI